MSEEKKNEREALSAREKELDDFWDISALVPPKKEVISRAPATVEITEITAPGRSEEKREADLSANACVGALFGSVSVRYILLTDSFCPCAPIIHRKR